MVSWIGEFVAFAFVVSQVSKRTNEQLNSFCFAFEKVFIIIYIYNYIYNNKPLLHIFLNKTVQLFVRSASPTSITIINTNYQFY